MIFNPAKNWKLIAPAIVLLVLACLLFANTFDNAWTYDDSAVVVGNPDIRSIAGFISNKNQGRPLRELTYMLDYALFGLNPTGYHVQQVLWHFLNSLLVYVLARRLKLSPFVAWTSSVFFLVHPIQVEVVANISHRKGSLMLFFSLLSIITFIEGFMPGKKKMPYIVFSILLGLAACLAKQIAVTLPLIFVAYEYAYVEPQERVFLKSKLMALILLLIMITSGSLWFYQSGILDNRYWQIQGILSKLNFFQLGTETTYLMTVLKSWVFMLLKFIYPYNLAVEYTFKIPSSWNDPWVLFAMLIAILYFLALFFTPRRLPAIFFMLVLSGAFWLPVSNIWPLAYLTADRYLYAPSVGIVIISIILIDLALSRVPLLKYITVFMIVILMSFLTVRQNQVWQNPITLWSNAVKVSPDSSYALSSLGSAYLEEGRAVEALPYLKRAIKNKYNSAAKSNLSEAYKILRQQKKGLDY